MPLTCRFCQNIISSSFSAPSHAASVHLDLEDDTPRQDYVHNILSGIVAQSPRVLASSISLAAFECNSGLRYSGWNFMTRTCLAISLKPGHYSPLSWSHYRNGGPTTSPTSHALRPSDLDTYVALHPSGHGHEGRTDLQGYTSRA